MENKKIFAALDIGTKFTKLVVGEFHNTKINILRVEQAPTMGVSNNMEIVDLESCAQVINKLVTNIEVILGFRLKKVLLSIPTKNIKVMLNSATISVNNPDQKISKNDVDISIRKASNIKIDEDKIIVNCVPVKYHINQISMRKTPIKEVADYLTTDCLIFCADKKMVYDYARCVEMAGLEILDIFLDCFASAKECAVIERSLDRSLIFIDSGAYNTSISLYSNGNLQAIDNLAIASEKINENISNRFNINYNLSEMIKIKYGKALLSEEDNLIYIHLDEDDSNLSLSENKLNQEICYGINAIIDPLKPFIEGHRNEKISIILTGGLAQMANIDKYISNYLNVDCCVYIPETLGARKSSLVTCLGLMYAYIDKNFEDIKVCSVDNKEFIESLNPKLRGFGVNGNQEDGFLKKLKSFLFVDKN